MTTVADLPPTFCDWLEDEARLRLWPIFDPALNPVGHRRISPPTQGVTLGSVVTRHRKGAAQYSPGPVFHDRAEAEAWQAREQPGCSMAAAHRAANGMEA